MGQKPSSGVIVSDFVQQVGSCSVSAAKDLIKGNDREKVDDRLQACLQSAIDSRQRKLRKAKEKGKVKARKTWLPSTQNRHNSNDEKEDDDEPNPPLSDLETLGILQDLANSATPSRTSLGHAKVSLMR